MMDPSSMSSSLVFSVLVLQAVALTTYAKSFDTSLATKSFELRSASKKPTEAGTEGICLTKECVEVAERVLKKLDLTTMPCNDFYTFACGRFINETDLGGKHEVGTLPSIVEERNEQKRRILEQPISDEDSRSAKIAKKVYKSCMNDQSRSTSLLQHINILFRKLGGWPVVEGENWNDADFDWITTTYKMEDVGLVVNRFINVSIATGNESKNGLVIQIEGPSRLQSLEQIDLQTSLEVVKELGANPSVASYELMKVHGLQEELKHMSSPEDKSQIPYNMHSTTIEKLEKEFPGFPWLEYINKSYFLHLNFKIEADQAVRIIAPNYIKRVLALLSKTDKRTVANYMFLCSSQILSSMFNFLDRMNINVDESDRSNQCLAVMGSPILLLLNVAVGSVFVRNYLKNDSKTEIIKLTNNINDSFVGMLSNADWMDETSRERSLEKAKAMIHILYYPDELLDDTELDLLFGDVDTYLNEETFFENLIKMQKYDTYFCTENGQIRIGLPLWLMFGNADEVNAYSSTQYNAVFIPGGYVHRSLFDSNSLQYMNYGGIGSTIGHEITHGFDNRGRQYDKNGNHVTWWDESTIGKFDSRAKCLIEQYNNYTEPMTNMNVNGLNTLPDNIADNGGVKAAYWAYRAWSEKQRSPEPRLPGLEWLSPRQMFWVSAAQNWCSKRSNEKMRKIMNDNHSPDRFRVIGSFSNSEDFSEDFRCDSNTRMNPKNKCTIW